MEEKSYRTVGKNLRSARWHRGWSQSFVSNQTGLSIRTISRAETGHGISKDTLKRLCSIYSLAIENVFTDDNKAIDRNNAVPSIPFDMAVRILAQSSFVQDIQREAILQLNDTVQRNAFMCREDIEGIILELLSSRKSYTTADIVEVALEVNRRTIQSIASIATA